MESWICELKENEESLMLKCNMLESTDPDLAQALWEVWDQEYIISKKPSWDIPKLDLDPIIQDRVREMAEESEEEVEEEEEEESIAADTEKKIEFPDDLESDWYQSDHTVTSWDLIAENMPKLNLGLAL